MRPRRGLVRDVYRAARALTRRGTGTNRSRVASTPWWGANGSHTAGSLARKRRVQRAANALRRYRKSKRMKMTKGSGGGGPVQRTIYCSINHKPQTYVKRGVKADMDIARGAGSCEGATGTQGYSSRIFFGGQDNGDGTNVQKILVNHSQTVASAMNTVFRNTGVKLEGISACNNCVVVTAYVLKCNRDIAAGALIVSPSAVWEKLANDYTDAQPPGNIDEDPTNCPGFGSWWKIIKKSRFTLNPGQAFRMNISTKEMWLPSNASLQASTGANFYAAVRGRTYAVMFVTKGFPVSNDTSTAVNYGPSKINYTWTFRCKTSRSEENPRVNRFNVLNTIDPLIAINTPPRLMNDDDGVVASYAKV